MFENCDHFELLLTFTYDHGALQHDVALERSIGTIEGRFIATRNFRSAMAGRSAESWKPSRIRWSPTRLVSLQYGKGPPPLFRCAACTRTNVAPAKRDAAGNGICLIPRRRAVRQAPARAPARTRIAPPSTAADALPLTAAPRHATRAARAAAAAGRPGRVPCRAIPLPAHSAAQHSTVHSIWCAFRKGGFFKGAFRDAPLKMRPANKNPDAPALGGAFKNPKLSGLAGMRSTKESVYKR